MARICLIFVGLLFGVSNIASAPCDTSVSGISCDPDEVKFYLYPNAADPTEFDELPFADIESIQNTSFSATKNIIMIIHDYNQDFNSNVPTLLRNAYLNNGFEEDNNIIVVDYGKLSGATATDSQFSLLLPFSFMNPEYVVAVDNVAIVGERVADFLTFLVENSLATANTIHVVGHGIGAHVGGKAAAVFQTSNNGVQLNRVTGTDPAGPLFVTPLITKNVATFVDIVHTNQPIYGSIENLGDVDFFVNFRFSQTLSCMSTPDFNSCYHDFAASYYAKSIGDNGMMASKQLCIWNCKQVVFGQFCPAGTEGVYSISS